MGGASGRFGIAGYLTVGVDTTCVGEFSTQRPQVGDGVRGGAAAASFAIPENATSAASRMVRYMYWFLLINVWSFSGLRYNQKSSPTA